jgi:hypothetical protein
MNNRLTITDLETFKGCKIWESQQSHGLQSVGAFGLKDVSQDFYLYPLDEFEVGQYADFKMRPNEKLFRYETKTSAIGGFFPLIKVNVESGLVYFQEDMYEEGLSFNKISDKPRYIDLNKTAV